MSATFESKIDNITDSLLKTIELAKLYGPPEMKNPKFYKTGVEKLIQIYSNGKTSHDTIQKLTNCETVAEFEQKYNGKKTHQYPTRFKLLNEQIKGTLSGNSDGLNVYEDDDMIMESCISDIDPITKKRIENPVKNKKCGHYYDKNSVLQSIKMNSKLRCPISGCKNKNFIKENDLEEDIQFRLRLQRTQTE